MSSRKKSDDAEVIRKKANTTDRGLSSLRGIPSSPPAPLCRSAQWLVPLRAALAGIGFVGGGRRGNPLDAHPNGRFQLSARRTDHICSYSFRRCADAKC